MHIIGQDQIMIMDEKMKQVLLNSYMIQAGPEMMPAFVSSGVYHVESLDFNLARIFDNMPMISFYDPQVQTIDVGGNFKPIGQKVKFFQSPVGGYNLVVAVAYAADFKELGFTAAQADYHMNVISIGNLIAESMLNLFRAEANIHQEAKIKEYCPGNSPPSKEAMPPYLGMFAELVMRSPQILK